MLEKIKEICKKIGGFAAGVVVFFVSVMFAGILLMDAFRGMVAEFMNAYGKIQDVIDGVKARKRETDEKP